MEAHLEHIDQFSLADAGHPRPERSTERRGLPVLFLFLGATLVMVAAVWLAGAIDHWWILIPVMAVDALMTVAVLAGVIRLINDDGER